ncbi:hypothetical protein ACFOEE_18075 [Pseudoalteromonas fenneropenaei]|uniref:Uncharacterized protein n=1 Tax=Pseudoalteromonas fenneropenaei TaxID=1737459 RepID=A0ABV7CPK1_9GAMM
MSWLDFFHFGQSKTVAKSPVVPACHCLFNATGTVLIVQHQNTTELLSEAAQALLFSAQAGLATILRALSTTLNPLTNQPYSIFNYHALQLLLSQGGRYIPVYANEVSIAHCQFQAQQHGDIATTLLGYPLTDAELPFAAGLMSRFANSAKQMQQYQHPQLRKACHAILCLEVLNGAPSVSLLLLSLDVQQHQQHLAQLPCHKSSNHCPDWQVRKEVYSFVG